jgi:hypothetical protein
MDHRTFRELAAGAALDDLDPGERASLDAHVVSCPPCREEARHLVDTAAMLTYAAPVRRPPASLRGSVLAAIAASEGRPVGIPAATMAYAGAGAVLPASAPAVPSRTETGSPRTSLVDLDALRRERSRYRALSFAGLAAAAAMVIAVAGLGATNAGLREDIAAVTTERDAAVASADAAAAALATTDQAMSVVLAPDHRTAQLTPDPVAGNAVVYAVYRPGTTEAWLMADLPTPPTGKVYQLWSADAAGVHALATFTCQEGHACLAEFGVDLGAAKATMITIEPVGGAVGDPGPQVAFGELQD